MYSIHSCPDGQPNADLSIRHQCHANLILHLQENRSYLPQEARVAFTALIGLFMAMAILPAIKGELLVPIFALGTMALLVGALDWHGRSNPAGEWLAIENDRLRWTNSHSDPVDLPVRATRLVQDEAVPAHMRLFLETQWQRIEIGRCLSLEEKRAVAALIHPELAALRP